MALIRMPRKAADVILCPAQLTFVVQVDHASQVERLLLSNENPRFERGFRNAYRYEWKPRFLCAL